MEKQNNMATIIFITCVATIGGFLFGFDSGVINGTIDGMQQAFNSDSVGTGFNVASMLLGCAAGAFFAGRLADQYGRKAMLMVAAVFFLVSAWGSGIAASSMEFIFYRLLGGLAVGAASVMAPAYISEIAPANIRGKLSSVQQVAIILGLFVSFLSNYLIAGIAGGSTEVLWLGFEAWRWMFWIEIVPSVLFLVSLYFIPESPRYLVAKNHIAQAESVLNKLGAHVESTINAIKVSLSAQNGSTNAPFKDPASGKIHKLVWVGLGLAIFQQFVGINVVFYYGAVLWQAVGFSESDALLINVLSGGISIMAVVIAIIFIEKVGRKPLLKFGSIGMSISLAVMVACFFFAQTGDDGALQLGDSGIVALIAANAYVFFFNLSWGPVMWVMLGEMFPNRMRGAGLGVAGLAQWGANFAITMTFPTLLATVGLAGAYSFYTISAIISILFVAKWVHETKGLELEEMDQAV